MKSVPMIIHNHTGRKPKTSATVGPMIGPAAGDRGEVVAEYHEPACDIIDPSFIPQRGHMAAVDVEKLSM